MRRVWLCFLLLSCGDDDGGGTVDAPLTPAHDAPLGADGPRAFDAKPPNLDIDAPANTPGCSVTLSGAQTGTFGCIVSAGKSDNESFSTVVIQVGGETSNIIVLTAKIDGSLTTGDQLDDLDEALASVVVGAFSTVVIQVGGEQDIGSIGILNLTSLEPTSGGGATVWVVHGAASAELVGQTTPTAKVQLSATF
jgi:hypothetical protein